MNIPKTTFLTILVLLPIHALIAENNNIDQENDKFIVQKDHPKKVVYVGGFVIRPGPIDYKEGAKVYAMIIAAGGPSKEGSMKRVAVFRDGKYTSYDMTDKKIQSTLLAKPNDTYDVPKMNWHEE